MIDYVSFIFIVICYRSEGGYILNLINYMDFFYKSYSCLLLTNFVAGIKNCFFTLNYFRFPVLFRDLNLDF
jgi:hypothetical protein